MFPLMTTLVKSPNTLHGSGLLPPIAALDSLHAVPSVIGQMTSCRNKAPGIRYRSFVGHFPSQDSVSIGGAVTVFQ